MEAYSPWFVALLGHKGYQVAWDNTYYHVSLRGYVVIALKPVLAKSSRDGSQRVELVVASAAYKQSVSLTGYSLALTDISNMWALAQASTRLPPPPYMKQMSGVHIPPTSMPQTKHQFQQQGLGAKEVSEPHLRDIHISEYDTQDLDPQRGLPIFVPYANQAEPPVAPVVPPPKTPPLVARPLEPPDPVPTKQQQAYKRTQSEIMRAQLDRLRPGRFDKPHDK